jgi:hypothetical protein
VRSADRVRNRFDGAFTELLGEWEQSLQHALSGFVTGQAWLAAETAMAAAAAKHWLRCAEDLRSMPLVREQSVSGALPHAKVRLLAKVRTPKLREVFADQEAYLVETVAGLTVDGAKAFLAAWKIRALAELGDDGPADPHAEDRLYLSSTFGGHHDLRGGFCAEDGAILAGGLNAEIDGWHRSGQLEGDERSRGQLRAAALMAIVRRGLVATRQHDEVRPLVIGLVDADTLAGRVATDEADVMAMRSEIFGADRSRPTPSSG